MTTRIPAQSNPLRVGVIGYGYWGSKHVRVLAGLPGVELTVIDGQPDRLREAMATFPAARVAGHLGDVEETLDAVVIATPPCSHGPIALQALQAGLHTLVEKPLATSVGWPKRSWRQPTRADRC